MAKTNRQNTAASAYEPTANPAYAEGMRGIRSSGKSGAHLDGRFRRQRTEQAALRVAVREQLDR